MEQTSETIVIRPVWMPQSSTDGGTVMGELGPLLDAYWREARPPHYGPFALNVEAFVRAWMSRELLFIEIRVERRLAGFVFVYRRQSLFCEDTIADIGSVFLLPEFRGRGLMRQAIQHVRELTQALDITHLYRSADQHGPVHRMTREELPCL